jgi:hypothetical protein
MNLSPMLLRGGAEERPRVVHRDTFRGHRLAAGGSWSVRSLVSLEAKIRAQRHIALASKVR